MTLQSFDRQGGSALLISLVLLVVLTLLAVTSIRTSSLNLRIAQNMQLQQEAEAAAQSVVEFVLSDIDWFNNPEKPFTITGDLPGYAEYTNNFAVNHRECLDSSPREGDQLDAGPDLGESESGGQPITTGAGVENNIWEVRASVNDPSTGSRATIRQGVLIPMLVGSCP